MARSTSNPSRDLSFAMRTVALAGMLLALGLFTASAASATFEQVDTFAGTPGLPKAPDEYAEEVQLGGVGGMAVNVSGAGGVPPGTIYAAGYSGGPHNGPYIARFDADGEFRKTWTFDSNPPGPCGPEVTPTPTACPSRGGGNSNNAFDVEVDQSTGNIYVFDGTTGYAAGTNLIHVYSPDGSKLIAEFGESAPAGQATSVSPGKIHRSSGHANIAVDAEGTVYVMDYNGQDNFYHRLMVFKPQTPGDYEHYIYAGQSHDIWAGFANETKYPTTPIADSAGDLFVAGESYIVKLDPTQPSAPALCEFRFPTGGIWAMTVNPENGEAFFFTYKDKRVHQLSPCNGEGKFEEVGSFGISPTRSYLTSLVFNPVLQLEPSRLAGVLYAGVPNGEGGKGEESLAESALGYIFTQPKEVSPKVEAQSVSNVTPTSAELSATINPKGSQTRYVFQYLTDTEYQQAGETFAGASEAPPGGAIAGEGQVGIGVAAAVSGLAPDTGYHYRAVATSHCSVAKPEKVCEEAGPDQTFRTFPLEVPGLPDRRAYELVSPVEKQGGQVLPAEPELGTCGQSECKPGSGYQHFPMQSTPEGDAVVYEGTPFSTEGAVIENEYLSKRSASGWQTTNLTPSLLTSKEGQGYRAFDSNLSRGVFEQTSPSLSPDAPSDFRNLYLQPTGSPTDLTSLLASEPPNRVAGTGSNSFRLTYAGASADLSRVFFEANDALTEATPFAPEATDGGEKANNLYEWAEGGLRLVNVLPGNAEAPPGATFGSGWQLKAGDFNNQYLVVTNAISADGSRVFWSSEAGQVYVRENAETTLRIEDPGKFLSASRDGSKVLLSDGCLYDLVAEACEDLTQGKGGFQGIAGQGEDLSRLYFVDTAALTGEEENDQGAKAQAGNNNLYAWDEGATSFVATLLDHEAGVTNRVGVRDWTASPSLRTAEASPDGRWLTFLSTTSLTGYDNTGPCETDGAGGFPCPEAYLYDSASGKLTCASCNPSNERPLGGTVLRLIAGAKGSMPQPRYLINQGRLYFDSQDSLVPADTNHGVEDVYQYEPGGVGSCEREAGCTSLVSSGSGVADSNFLAIDESAKSVFFTTRDQLVQRDHDELIDLYVAREEGGIPSETEVARGECQGEACQPQASAPNDPTPGSSTFEGSGNVDEKKPARKHKRKHAKKHKAKKKSAHKRAASNNRGGAK